MSDVRELRPYLDLLVDGVLERADIAPVTDMRRRGIRRRWPVAIAAALVLGALVAAVLVIRSTSSTGRSVQVPAQQPSVEPNADAESPFGMKACEAQAAASNPASLYSDRATDQAVEISPKEYCRQLMDLMPWSPVDLSEAGVVGLIGVENGRVAVQYFEMVRTETDNGNGSHGVTVGTNGVVLTREQVAQRVRDVKAKR